MYRRIHWLSQHMLHYCYMAWISSHQCLLHKLHLGSPLRSHNWNHWQDRDRFLTKYKEKCSIFNRYTCIKKTQRSGFTFKVLSLIIKLNQTELIVVIYWTGYNWKIALHVWSHPATSLLPANLSYVKSWPKAWRQLKNKWTLFSPTPSHIDPSKKDVGPIFQHCFGG